MSEESTIASEAEISVEELEKVGTKEETPEPDESDTEQDEAKDQKTEETPEETDEDDESGDEEEAEEELEFTFGHEKLAVPKSKIPEEIAAKVDQFSRNLWSDYNKKCESVAESRKSLEAREGEIKKLETMNDEMLGTYSEGLTLKAQLKELEELQKIPENTWQQDPDKARQISDALSATQNQLNQVSSKFEQQSQNLTQAQKAESMRRFEEGKAKAEKRVKGISSKIPEVIDYVHTKFGYDKKMLEETWALNPDSAEMALKSMLFDKMQEKVNTQAKPKKKPASAIKSVKATGTKASKDPDKMSVEEWVRWRNAALKKKQKAGY